MSDGTKIEWTDATWTPIRARFWEIQDDGSGKERIGWHCEHVSEGCRNCYAEGINRRLGTGLDFKPGNLFRQERVGHCNGESKLFLDEKTLLQPLKWKKPRTIFVCSMTDLFADFVTDEMIDRVFAVMALCPQHRFQVLTKRSARMREAVARIGRSIDILERQARKIGHTLKWEVQANVAAVIGRRPGDKIGLVPWPLHNVWLGVSAEDQARADERIPDLLATPAAVRFVSLEPLLGAIDLVHLRVSQPDEHTVFRTRDALTGKHGHGGKFGYTEAIDHPGAHLDWVIVGGESGPNARPMHPYWARSIRDQCQAAGVPFFFKQWGEWAPRSDHDWYTEHHTSLPMVVWDGSRWRDDDGAIDGEWMIRVGKKRAGRLLDGVEHNGMPA